MTANEGRGGGRKGNEDGVNVEGEKEKGEEEGKLRKMYMMKKRKEYGLEE